jgi:hypothetical protein
LLARPAKGITINVALLAPALCVRPNALAKEPASLLAEQVMLSGK